MNSKAHPVERVKIHPFRHPWIKGTDIDPECGRTWHDHGWIDRGDHGFTICPTEAEKLTTSDQAWLVSSGSYSDYRVLCAAPSKEAAYDIADALNPTDRWDSYFVEDVPVFEKAERITVYGLEAVIGDDGTVSAEAVRDREEWNVDPLYPHRLRPVAVRWVRAPCYNDQAGRLEVYGLDQKLVRETFSDLKAQLLADPKLRLRREFTR